MLSNLTIFSSFSLFISLPSFSLLYLSLFLSLHLSFSLYSSVSLSLSFLLLLSPSFSSLSLFLSPSFSLTLFLSLLLFLFFPILLYLLTLGQKFDFSLKETFRPIFDSIHFKNRFHRGFKRLVLWKFRKNDF